MKLDSMVSEAMREFKQNLERVCPDLEGAELTPELAQAVTQGIQESLALAGRACLGEFLRSHESGLDVVRDAEGEVYRFKQVRRRNFMTVFGKLSVERRCYQNAADTRSFVPLDAAWGMQGRYLTPAVREAVLLASAHMTSSEVELLLGKCALFRVDTSTIKREVKDTGAFVQSNREALDAAVHAREHTPGDTKAMVVSADGATVLMNEKGARFGRPAERPGAIQPGQKPTAYRVAMAGCVSYYGGAHGAGQKPERLQSRYVAHMPQAGCPTFKAMLEDELDAAEARLPADVPRILLLDGARELWSYFDKHPRYDGYRRCIDFWHAVEHLSVAAEALFGSGGQAKNWYDKYYRVLLEHDDGAARIVRSIDYYKTVRKRSPTSAKHLEEQRTYFKRNGHRMPYATFRANGWPIGSGPMEAACKTLIKTRMCRSGMRWKPSTGQSVLALRAYAKSGRWEYAWKEIEHLENAA